MIRIDPILVAVGKEVQRAMLKFGSFQNFHEGYAVLLEEVDELWDEIKGQQRGGALAEEAIQVAAMAVRFAHDLLEEADIADGQRSGGAGFMGGSL